MRHLIHPINTSARTLQDWPVVTNEHFKSLEQNHCDSVKPKHFKTNNRLHDRKHTRLTDRLQNSLQSEALLVVLQPFRFATLMAALSGNNEDGKANDKTRRGYLFTWQKGPRPVQTPPATQFEPRTPESNTCYSTERFLEQGRVNNLITGR